MKRRLILLLAAFAAACSSGTYSATEIFVEGTSQQESCEYIYFRVPEGTECAGIRIRRDGTKRYLSFMRAGEVDSAATMPNDYSWEGMLRVEVPIDEETLAHGGTMELIVDGPGANRGIGEFGYISPEEQRLFLEQSEQK